MPVEVIVGLDLLGERQDIHAKVFFGDVAHIADLYNDG